MPDNWIGMVETIATRYIKGAEDATVRKRILLAMLQKRGNVKFNVPGLDKEWRIKYRVPAPSGYTDGGVIDYTRQDIYRHFSIGQRMAVNPDMMTELERKACRGDAEIVSRYNAIIPGLLEGCRDNFSKEIWGDGYASGNENKLIGLNSFTGAGTVAATDRLAAPSDTYGGQSTVLGTEGGTWTDDIDASGDPPNASLGTDWPYGQGDYEYDWNSPKLVNYTASTWGTGLTTWRDNCEAAISEALVWSMLHAGPDDKIDLCLVSAPMWTEYKNKMRSRMRILVPHKEADDLGFSDTLNQDGCAITTDYDVPANTGMGLSLNNIEICSMNDTLFDQKKPEYDPRTLSWLFLVAFFGHVSFKKVKPFFKLAAYA